MVNPFSNLKDEELMVLYQQGEYSAFEEIYTRHRSRLYSYLKKRLKEEQAVEDVFQNSLIKFHKARFKYDSNHSLIKWLYTITKSELLDYLKKPAHHHIPLEDYHVPEEPFQEPGKDIKVDEESSLSAKEKQVINLRYYSDKDFIDISKQLNTSQVNIRKIVSRGLKKLRLKYAEKLND